MGNSCPPCQCNTDSDRPYYDLTNASLKQMQCMPEDTSKQLTKQQKTKLNECLTTSQKELTAALMKTDCPNVDWEKGEFPVCMKNLSIYNKNKLNNALKECNEAVLDYLKKPNARTFINTGPERLQLQNLCDMLVNNKKSDEFEQSSPSRPPPRGPGSGPRPYYDLTLLTLKTFDCVPDHDLMKGLDSISQENKMKTMEQCVQKIRPEMDAAVQKTECRDSEWQHGKLPACLSELEDKKNVMKECNDAVSDYLKEPKARQYVNTGPERVRIDDFCNMFVNNKKPPRGSGPPPRGPPMPRPTGGGPPMPRPRIRPVNQFT